MAKIYLDTHKAQAAQYLIEKLQEELTLTKALYRHETQYIPELQQQLETAIKAHSDLTKMYNLLAEDRERFIKERDDFERKWLAALKVPEILELKKQIALLRDQNRWYVEKMADLDIVNAELRDEKRELHTEIQFLKSQQEVIVTALDRIANMKNRDGVEIEMHRDELRAIAKTALGRK